MWDCGHDLPFLDKDRLARDELTGDWNILKIVSVAFRSTR